MRKLTGLRPTWKHGPGGERLGLIFNCPLCQPPGVCAVDLNFGGSESLEKLNIETPFHGSTAACKLSGTIKDGFVHYDR